MIHILYNNIYKFLILVSSYITFMIRSYVKKYDRYRNEIMILLPILYFVSPLPDTMFYY